MFLLVGAAGLILSGLLAWRSGNWGVLVKAVGQLITMMIFWLGLNRCAHDVEAGHCERSWRRLPPRT